MVDMDILEFDVEGCDDGCCCSLLHDVGYEHWITVHLLFVLSTTTFDVLWHLLSEAAEVAMPVDCNDIWLTECVWLFFGLSAFWFNIIVPVDVADDSVESGNSVNLDSSFWFGSKNFVLFFSYFKNIK